MRGYTNAAGGGTLASIAFDREAFAEYLEQLGSINDVRDRLQDFLDSVAYSFTSGTITADKFVTAGNNLLPRLDSFEDEQGRSIPMFPNNGVINAAIPVIASDPYYPAPHGETVLKITTPVAAGPFTFYLNPYNNNDSTWFKLGKMDYWFSYYLYTTSPLAVTGSIDLLNTTNTIISSVAFSITQAQGWLRFSNNFTLAVNSDVKFRVKINQGGQNLYLDAIQVEYKYITTPVPTNFAPGGKVVIEGGNIRANSISASDAIFQDAAIVDANIANINAAKIDAGIVNTNVVTVGDYDRGLMTMFDNNLTFYEPIDATTQMKRVSIGKLDSSGTNWGLEVRGLDGTTVLFDHTGLTSLGTTDGLTKAAYIDENLDIYGSKLRDGSIEGSIKIAANSIVSDNIAAGAITTNTLAANAVTAEKITAETINASHLNSNIVTSKLIQLGETTVTAGIYGGGTTDSNIRFWAGDTFANRETAPFRVTQDGKLYATGANIIAGYATNTELNNSINSVLADAQAYADILSEDLQSQLDGNITTWFYPVEPTLVNAPAVDWTTEELKNVHLGDLYYDTVTGYSYRFALISTVYQWIRITDVDVTKALSDAANAQDTADSKRRVFTAQPIPPYDTGDLWSQGLSGDLMLCVVSRQTGVYSASDWAKASKYTDDTTAINNLAAAKLYADGKAAEAQAAAEAVAVAEASLAQSQASAYADGIVSAEEQARIDEDQAVLNAAKADALAKAQAAESAAKAYTDSQLNDFGITINNSLGDLQNQIDGSMTTWFYEVAPTNTNPPAINWTTTELKNNHLGDLYYDTVTGYAYRWQLDTGIYSWQRLLDIDVVQALSDAATAQDTADSKRRVFTSQPTTPYDIGDLWVQGISGDIMNCIVARATGTYSATDWVKASKYTDDAVALAAAQAASDAQDSADAANLLLADLSSDDRLTAVEKQSTKKEWDVIVAEKAGLEAQANLFSITTEKTSYTNSYNTLNSYITPLLADLTTTSTIVGTTFRTNFKNYYNARTVLLNKIASVSKSLIDTKAPTVITSTTTPTLPVIGQQWVDLNLTPPMMKVWNGTAWIFTNYTASEFDVEVSSISLAVAQSEITSSVTPILTSYGTRISNAETKITPTAITNTVRSSTEYANDLGTKENNVIKQSTAPTHLAGKLWLDTSVTPNILKRSDGTNWIKATPTTAGEVGAYASSDGIALATRVSTAETKITPTAITSTVRSSTEYINDLGSKYNLSSGSALEQTVNGLTLTVGDYENGILTGTKYTFDGTMATFQGGGLKIKNNAGTDVFYADTNGNLTFSGALSGATGTFSGSLSAATGTFSGSLSAATGSFSGTVTTGALTATGGSIAGWTIGNNTLSKGTFILNNSDNTIQLESSAYLKGYSSGYIGLYGQLILPNSTSSIQINDSNGNIKIGGGSITALNSASGFKSVNLNGNPILTTASTATDTVKGPIKLKLTGTTLYIYQ